jgi:hypothetical protein
MSFPLDDITTRDRTWRILLDGVGPVKSFRKALGEGDEAATFPSSRNHGLRPKPEAVIGG